MKENEEVIFTWFDKRKILGSHALLYITCIEEFFPFTIGTDVYITKRKMIIVFIIMLPTVTIPTKCPTIAPEIASPTKKRDPRGIRTDWWVYIRTCGSGVE